jgi:hypothetical protein
MNIFQIWEDIPISVKLIAFSFILIILPITAVGTLTYMSSREAIYEETEIKLSEQVLFVQDYIRSTLDNLQDKVRSNLEVAQNFIHLYGVPAVGDEGDLILKLKDT